MSTPANFTRKHFLAAILLGFIIQAAVSFVPQNALECSFRYNDPVLGPSGQIVDDVALLFGSRPVGKSIDCRVYRADDLHLGFPAYVISYNRGPGVPYSEQVSALKLVINLILWHGLAFALVALFTARRMRLHGTTHPSANLDEPRR